MSTGVLRWPAGELPVQTGRLNLHARGAWAARVVCPVLDASMVAPTGPAALVLRRETGAEDLFVGRVRRSGIAKGSARLDVALVGGAGRLLLELDPKGLDFAAAMTALPAGDVARKIAEAAGEVLADGVEAALDAYQLPRWHVAGGMTGAESLDAFVGELARLTGFEIGWRPLPSGRLWIGRETWPTLTHAARPLEPDLDDGALEYAPAGGELLAGWTVDGRRALEVAYVLQPGSLRATVRGSVAGDPPHRLALDLYRASYRATVLAQRADGTLDLRCEDVRIGDLIAVPFRLGIPGCSVTVPEGAVVRVRFESASPAGAYACDVDQDAAPTRPFALVEDPIHVGTLSGVADPITGIVAFAYSQPNGLPQAGPIIELAGLITGLGHKYARGVPAS